MSISANALRNLDEAVKCRMATDDIPGLIVAITDRDQLLYQQTYGYASIEAQEPVRLDHRFEYGSIGKSFTSILMLQLAEEGLIDLHEPVIEYLPWFEVQSEFAPITPYHLMTHTAGIIGGTDFPADPRFEVWSLRETRAVNPPGEHFHYSNVGYKTLGLLLERVTGWSYARLIQERILDPLDLKDTDPAITHATRRHLATGYQYLYDDRPWRREHGHAPATWLETDTADGCIAGTAADLACYLRMLMNGGQCPGGPVLSKEAFEMMTKPHARLPDARLDSESIESGGYGCGLYSYVENGHQYLGHGGGMVGYHTQMLADLTTGYGVTVLINGPGQCLPVAEYALEVLRANALGEELPPPPDEHNPRHIEEPASFTGQYRGNSEDIEIKGDGNQLRVRWNGNEAPMQTRGEDTFLVDHPDFELFLLRFERDDGGEVVTTTHGNRIWHSKEQPEDRPSVPEAWRAFPGHYRSHNPWLGNFRVILRGEKLYVTTPGDYEEPITPRSDGVFRVGDETSPEFIRFDTIVDGEAWRASFSGCDYYRFFTP